MAEIVTRCPACGWAEGTNLDCWTCVKRRDELREVR